MRFCDVITTWSHRMDHQVLTCDFLFLIMRLLTHSIGLIKWGEHPQQQQVFAKKEATYEKDKTPSSGLNLGRPGLGIETIPLT